MLMIVFDVFVVVFVIAVGSSEITPTILLDKGLYCIMSVQNIGQIGLCVGVATAAATASRLLEQYLL